MILPGLLFHLDAQQVSEPRQSGDPMERWSSTSGSQSVEFLADSEAARPHWHTIGQQRVARFDRGTIQRVSPDFSKRETVCTGIRFPIGLEFNSHGDLFCTDQEGATWLPNGNPFDELLHIRKGKHYGFPPRHPKHNPNVIDEPSVFDYGPQHQSTCGMFFNPDITSASHIGPAYWSDNAIVTGESRGKLYRTQLVKTDCGYVAQTQSIACLQMLTIDACAAPTGAMVVACHSGPPDWGTGPAGTGELFKIAPAKIETPIPRPVLAWFSAPGEIAIAFDAPLDPNRVKDWIQAIDVYAGSYVRAGDRYETLSPPYAVVKAQSMSPRRRIDVSSLGMSPDQRTLRVRIPTQTSDQHYAVGTSSIQAMRSIRNSSATSFGSATAPS